MTIKKGHRELKPVEGNQGVTVCLSGKNWVSSVIKKNQAIKKGGKKVITESKTRFIPDAVIASLKLKDSLFVQSETVNSVKK